MKRNVVYIGLAIVLAITLPSAHVLAGNPAGNLIDQMISLESKSKLKPNSTVDDRRFLRRIYLDLAGRLPTPAITEAFLADDDPDKRKAIVEQIMQSEQFTFRWAKFLNNMLENQTNLVTFFDYRNDMWRALISRVEANAGWDEVARYMLTYAGRQPSDENPVRYFVTEENFIGHRMDVIDDMAVKVSANMLGVQINCISCHDGYGHLEKVNVDLSMRTREDFWGMAALLSSSTPYMQGGQNGMTSILDLDIDHGVFLQQANLLGGQPMNEDGEYRAQTEPGEGMREPRRGGLIQPRYLFTGETPAEGESRRQALARFITSDRQFARNMVNRLWAHFFGEGFVMPLDGWDLARLSPDVAAEFGTTVQPRDYQLMEVLTDRFIDSGFDMRAMMKLITGSYLYQMDYASVTADPDRSPHVSYWTTNRRVRRMEAETIFDNLNQVLQWNWRIMATGLGPVTYDTAWAMPDSADPSNFSNLGDFGNQLYSLAELGYANTFEFQTIQQGSQDLLRKFGRTVSITRPDSISTGVPVALTLMNHEVIHDNLFAGYVPFIETDAINVDFDNTTLEDMIQTYFHRFLFRDATEEETSLVMEIFETKDTRQALRELAWALANHPDFIYK